MTDGDDAGEDAGQEPAPPEAAPGTGRRQRRREQPNERLRVPAPLIRSRLPSGRGAMEQPNVTGDGDAPLTLRFWLALVVTGIATGLAGALMMLVLHGVAHLAFSYHSGSFESAVKAVSGQRRVVVLLLAGVIGGVGWYLLRRLTEGEKSEVDDVLWNGDARLSLRRSFISGTLSEIVIGMGASIGRENAPKLLGGVSGSLIADRLGLTDGQRRLLVACGAGSGLGAVYNVPLGGAIFTAEILVGSLAVPVVLPAIVCSWIATVTAWVSLPDRATYLDIPDYHLTAPIVVWALLVGPVVGLLAAGFIRLIGWVSHHQLQGRLALVAPVGAFGVLGLLGIAYPQLFGNGKDMAHDAFVGQGTLVLFLALFALKPLVTALCLGSGTSGGLFTPAFSTGAVLGACLGGAWSLVWPGSPIGAYAIIAAAAMIGASMQAPLAAMVLVVELTHSGFSLLVPMLMATGTATLVSRQLDGYSIYSARLPGTGD